ncbi:RCC1 domain-containing protein 1 [Eumeta japonica]|uniref:RCC1 domain-containing protein 1 n=1 Tax=Eumeta variegata TaxID=151549 RepID=A0A4C1ZTK1_EUMVA|nr:RCC1 domain-containing protein 1 [Eumeta japonica]
MLTDKGLIYTWGNGRRCQLGHGEIHNLEEPTEVEALAGINIVKIQAGGWHCLALSDSGDLYAWGWNDIGQLGICENPTNKNIVKNYPLPTLVDLYDNNGHNVEKNVKDIAAGTRHSYPIVIAVGVTISPFRDEFSSSGAPAKASHLARTPHSELDASCTISSQPVRTHYISRRYFCAPRTIIRCGRHHSARICRRVTEFSATTEFDAA